MLFDCICVACMVLGTIVGGVAGCLVAGRYLDPTTDQLSQPLDPGVDAAIEQAATHWAEVRGRPWAAPLIADKLRLVYRLGLLVLAGGLLESGPTPNGSPVKDEAKLRVGLELHAIRRDLDVSYLKHQARADAQRLRRELDQELDALDGGQHR
jgi:hypothetical protein